MTLVIALMSTALLTALGSAMVVSTMTETMIAATFRQGIEALYAAEGAAAAVVQELEGVSDWEAIVNGEEVSPFADGPASGTRRIGAVTLDLTEATEAVNALAEPGAGPYSLYAFGRLQGLVPGAETLSIYVLVWVADRPDPPGEESEGPGLAVISRAYGPAGSRRSVAVTLSRPVDPGSDGGVRIGSWRELR